MKIISFIVAIVAMPLLVSCGAGNSDNSNNESCNHSHEDGIEHEHAETHQHPDGQESFEVETE